MEQTAAKSMVGESLAEESSAKGSPAKEAAATRFSTKDTLNKGREDRVDDQISPLNTWYPLEHERVLVFLAWRNVFASDEIATYSKNSMTDENLNLFLHNRVDQLFDTRKHVTPNTSKAQLFEHIYQLFRAKCFSASSHLRRQYIDIKDVDIFNRSEEIRERIPSCPWPVKKEESFSKNPRWKQPGTLTTSREDVATRVEMLPRNSPNKTAQAPRAVSDDCII